MDGNQADGNLVCLICLECSTFPLKLESNSSSSNQSSKTNKTVNTNTKDQETTPKFIKFCKTFLQVQTDVNGGQLWNKGLFKSKKEDLWGRLSFCGDCEVLVKNVLRLHADFNVTKARLLWKVSELRKVINQGNGGVGGYLSNEEGIGKQSNVDDLLGNRRGGAELEKFRKNLENKCAEKSRRLFPVVTLNKNALETNKGRHEETVGSVVLSKSDLDFTISFVIVIALVKNWNLQEIIATHRTQHFQSKDSFSIKRETLDSFSINDTQSLGDENTVSTSTNLHNNANDEEPSNHFEGSLEDDDRNSDVSMSFDFVEGNLHQIKHPCSPVYNPSPTQEYDDAPPPNSETTPSATLKLKRGRGRPRKTALKLNSDNTSSSCVGTEHPPTNATVNLPEISDLAEGSYRLRKRSITKPKVLQGHDEPEADNDKTESDKDEYKPQPPRKVQRRRRQPTKGAKDADKIKITTSSGVAMPLSSQTRWQCKVCKQNFRVRKELKRHKRILRHHYHSLQLQPKRRKMMCDQCPERFFKPSTFFDHKVHKHDGGPEKLQLICKTCDTETKTVNELLAHLRETHEDPEIKSNFCPQCPDSYTTTQCLELHRRLDHWKLPPLFCDDNDCSNSYFSVEELNSHMREDSSHQGKEIFHCEYCNLGFFSNSHRTLHKLNHYSKSEEGLFECPEVSCWRKFRLLPAALNHYNRRHMSLQEKVRLMFCRRSHLFCTFSKGELEFHMKSHSPVPNYYCGVCDEEFSTNYLKRIHCDNLKHLQRAVEAEEMVKKEEGQAEVVNNVPIMKCSICQEIFPSRATLQLHRRVKHTNWKKKLFHERHHSDYCCDVCGKGFSDRYKLARHAPTHGEPQFQCPHCHKFYRREQTLQVHINRTHTKADMYVCEVCGKACPNKSEYNYHKSEHLLLHCCHLCPKKFSRGWSLKGHMRVHTGEKLQCEWCPVMYSALGNMKSHVKESHPEEYQYHYGTKNHRTALRFRIVKPVQNEGGGGDATVTSMEESI